MTIPDVRRDPFGGLYFVANLPASMRIGRRFELIRESSRFDGDVPVEELIQAIQDRLAAQVDAIKELARRDHPSLHSRLADQGLWDRLREGPWGEHQGQYDDAIAQITDILAASAVRPGTGVPGAGPSDESDLIEEFEDVARRVEADDRPTELPPGMVCIDCGEGSDVTDNQISMFGWLNGNQDEFFGALLERLRALYAELLPDYERQLKIKAGERPHLPEIICGDEADDLFRISEIHLHRTEGSFGLVLHCAFIDYAMMGVLVEDFEITHIGDDGIAYVNS